MEDKCVWKYKEKNEFYYKATSPHKNLDCMIDNSSKWKYCPYCGKEIEYDYKITWMKEICELCDEYRQLDGLEDAKRASEIPDEILAITEKEIISEFMSWLCDKYEVFEPEDDSYTLYGDMKYHSKDELLKEFKTEIGMK